MPLKLPLNHELIEATYSSQGNTCNAAHTMEVLYNVGSLKQIHSLKIFERSINEDYVFDLTNQWCGALLAM
jgi:hypothetical protein